MPLKNFTTLTVSLVLSFLMGEFAWRMWTHVPNETTFTHRMMLFQYGENFQNTSQIFKYFPNKVIRSVTLYSTENPAEKSDIALEYDYLIHTNNAGLVMRQDIDPVRSHLYIIGDSFTEGQGATPWFYRLEETENTKHEQLINAGLLGTGPSQWQLLVDQLVSAGSTHLVGAVINIIPYDLHRGVWNFNTRELNCLRNLQCDYNFGFQGFDFSKHATEAEILEAAILALKASKSSARSDGRDNYLELVKELLKRSKLLLELNYLLREIPANNKASEKNFTALLQLKERFGGRVVVNVIAQKGMPADQFQNHRDARSLLRFLESQNFDFFICDIPQEKFHKYDGHPDASGYAYLEQCNARGVNRIRVLFPKVQKDVAAGNNIDFNGSN